MVSRSSGCFGHCLELLQTPGNCVPLGVRSRRTCRACLGRLGCRYHAPRARLPLSFANLRWRSTISHAHPGVRGGVGRGLRDGGCADGRIERHAVEKYGAARLPSLSSASSRSSPRANSSTASRSCRVDSLLQRLPAEGAVHCPGFQGTEAPVPARPVQRSWTCRLPDGPSMAITIGLSRHCVRFRLWLVIDRRDLLMGGFPVRSACDLSRGQLPQSPGRQSVVG